MKKLIIASFLILPTLALAQTSENTCPEIQASQILMNAITVCPADQNPALGLVELGGNGYSNVKLESDGVATATIVHDPRLLNSHVGAPLQVKGDISIEMTYPAPGFGLVCKLTVNKFHP